MHLVAAVLAVATLSAGGTPVSVYDFKVKTIDGKEASLAEYKGKALLIVNTASECGYTPQYAGLEALYEKYRDRGFTVLGFPSNDFGGQEPGTNAEIKKFCELRYKTTFPLFSKIPVKGAEADPLYKYLTGLPGKQGGAITLELQQVPRRARTGRSSSTSTAGSTRCRPSSPASSSRCSRTRGDRGPG